MDAGRRCRGGARRRRGRVLDRPSLEATGAVNIGAERRGRTFYANQRNIDVQNFLALNEGRVRVVTYPAENRKTEVHNVESAVPVNEPLDR